MIVLDLVEAAFESLIPLKTKQSIVRDFEMLPTATLELIVTLRVVEGKEGAPLQRTEDTANHLVTSHEVVPDLASGVKKMPNPKPIKVTKVDPDAAIFPPWKVLIIPTDIEQQRDKLYASCPFDKITPRLCIVRRVYRQVRDVSEIQVDEKQADNPDLKDSVESESPK